MGRSYRIGRSGSGVGHSARARGGVHQAGAFDRVPGCAGVEHGRPVLRRQNAARRHRVRRLGGLGAPLTVAYGMFSGTEPVSVAKVLLIVGLIACVIGLKLVHDGS